MGDRLLVSDFEPHIASRFRITDGAATAVDLELTSATTLPSGQTADSPGSGFSLLFRGPLEPELEQMIRHLDHGELGELDVFLVPVSEDGDGRYYEAIFHYLDD